MGIVIAASLAGSSTASADWPISRHDTHRTGVSGLGSNIKKPAAYWRARLGGSLSQGQLYVGDIDKDGKEDVLFISGGDLVLAKPDGTTLWRTGPRGFVSIAGVADLNGDGQLDVIIAAPTKVSVIAATTGKVDWEEPGELGSAGAFRIGDLDGDGTSDLWLDTCGCCTVETGSPGILYSFASGFGAPKHLGKPPVRSHCGASSDTLADLDGDGQLDLISMSDDVAQMFRADGTIVATSGKLPSRAFAAQCEAANLDGKPGDELVCFTNVVYSGAGERGVFALAYRPADDPPLKLLWNAEVSAADSGDARAGTRLAVDLDGDGKLEVVASGRANGVYTTSVRDGETGAELTTTSGVVVGDVPGSVPGQRLLLVSKGTQVVAHSFTRNPPALTLQWQLADQRVLTGYDWARAATSSRVLSFALPDLNGDSKGDLVVGSTSEIAVVMGFDLAVALPGPIAHFALEPGLSATAVGIPLESGGTSSLVVARNDGYVELFDAGLKPTNLGVEGVPPLPALYVGGYYTGAGAFSPYGRAPIAGKLAPGDKVDSVLVVDSRGDVVAFDPSGATNGAPAKAKWRLTDSFGAGMRPAGAQSAAIGVFRRQHPIADPPQYVMASIDGAGLQVGTLLLPRPPSWDVLPADLAGDGSVSFVGLDVDPGLKTDITAMSANGTSLWQVPVVNVAGTMPFAIGDWNGDGADDVVAAINVAHVFSGKTGGEVATSATGFMYYMPILAGLSGGPKLDMVLQGGYFPARALGNDMAPLWTAAAPGQPYPFGSLATCPSGAVLAEGSFSSSAQLTLTQASGASPGATTSVVLASGAAYPTVAAAVAAGATLGQLGDVATSTDLDGTGAGPTALVGSTDGYLYAVDACSGSLRWAHLFGSPVGAPILADTDGDGKDEILVSVADGYLYGLRNEVLPAPASIWDTDPPNGITDHDVDQIITTKTLYATWAAVDGAVSYELAAIGGDGTFLTQPSWIDVGAVTSATLDNLALVDGVKVFVSVRAVSPAGRSPDVPSNGVVVHFAAKPDAGAGGTGGSGTGGSGTGGSGTGGFGTGGSGTGGSGTGGSGNGGSGTGGSGTGGTTGHDAGAGGVGARDAGAGGVGPAPASPAAPAEDSSCSCSVPGGAPNRSGAPLALAAGLFAFLRRRRHYAAVPARCSSKGG